jgi:hypothetical protein
MHRHQWKRVGYRHVEVVDCQERHVRWDTDFYYECQRCKKPKHAILRDCHWEESE